MVTAAVAGAVVGIAIVVALFAWRSNDRFVEAPRTGDRSRRERNWAPPGLGLVTAFLLLAATGMLAVAAAGGVAAALAPRLVRQRGGDADRRARVEAIAAWTEMLRDAVASGRGVQEAISVTAPLAPAAIRPATIALRTRSVRGPLAPALRQFADEVADPMADLVTAALTLAATREVRELADLLGTLAHTTRQRAALRLSAEAGRAGMRTTSRAIAGLTILVVAGMFGLDPGYLAPYATPIGQLVALAAASWFGLGLWGLSRMGRPPAGRRLRLREVTP